MKICCFPLEEYYRNIDICSSDGNLVETRLPKYLGFPTLRVLGLLYRPYSSKVRKDNDVEYRLEFTDANNIIDRPYKNVRTITFLKNQFK